MSQKILFDSEKIKKFIENIADSIYKSYPCLDKIVLIGILSAGYPLANRIAKILKQKHDGTIAVGKLDVALYRDDLLSRGKFVTLRETDIPFDLKDKTVIIVDDVFFNGRTIRAGLNALLDFGRPSSIELAVLIDRGHRELPIVANYVGKKIETKKTDHIKLNIYEIDGEDSIILET